MVREKGGELIDVDKWKIVHDMDGVPQEKNGFDSGVFAYIFADFISHDRTLSFSQDDTTNQNAENKFHFQY